jgi:hypothetical protein
LRQGDYFVQSVLAIRREEREELLRFAPWALVTGTFSGSPAASTAQNANAEK